MHLLTRYFDLKYCERCGSLWLRNSQSSETLCFHCNEEESLTPAGLAARLFSRRTHRPTRGIALPSEVQA